jgi:hypothetical protein
MKNFINWLITSSADPENTSLALKGILTVIGGYIVNIASIACSVGIYCLPITATWLTDMIGAIITGVHAGLLLTGAALTLFGLVRKLILGRWSAPTT